ncbi:peptidase domain-containing ABC transporter [Anaerosacchariphilus polymeriproducens]|uniref:Peptidase domain-containing ABC transporter n=1 Tax=Anaerosacchariphilus polymeriproducens TaxID=1812858 RepID=A0A371AW78_9FIRM|nr:peptidase domain-containing ABC transporter [Anaerosacchariphilus polymeriproducens]RDU23828.1 peptidase domain-containing ABC transporter [Anaerosacchariphilus polymeriproducens]
MKKVRFIEQMEHSECGLACVSMLCNHYQYNINLSKLREIYGVPVGGYTLFQLKQILSDFKIESKGIKILDLDALDKSFFPFIAFWENKHFVIVERAGRNKVLIVDPASGRRWIDRQEFNKNFSQSALIAKPGEEFQSYKDSNSVHYFLSILKKNKPLLVKLCLTSILVQAISLFIPIAMQQLIDKVIATINMSFLNKVGICIVFFGVLFYFLNLFRSFMIVKLQVLFDNELMTKLLSHLLNLPYSFFTNRSTGELLYRVNSNLIIRQILTQRFVSIFIDSLLIFIYLFMMFNYSASLSIIVLVVSCILILVSVFHSYKINQITNLELLQQTLVQKSLNETINGIMTIKSMGKEEVFYSNWKEPFNLQLKHSKEKGNWSAVLSNISNIIQIVFPIFLIWYGSFSLSESFFTLGMLVAFNTLASSFMQPVISLSSSYTDIMVLKTYLNKLYDIINTNTEQGLLEESHQIKDGDINLENIYFKYSMFDDYTLKNLSLRITPGEKIAIVGKSGSGKSTLLKILLGLYPPQQGNVTIDGVNVNHINIRDYRKQIGIVLQEPQLFNSTIKENIIFGNKDIDDKYVNAVSKKAGIEEIIKSLPLGLETILSEKGINLSGGQRQKIALARALIHNPKILFMDEPTSSLDNEAEKDFMNQIFKLDTTCVVISHRLSTIDKFNRILVMDHGEIVEQGTHKELLDLKGYYYNIYKNG